MFDRQGKLVRTLGEPGNWWQPMSTESGRGEVYVRPFDSSRLALGPEKWQVSAPGESGGGVLGMVQWRQDGRELYYLAADGGVMAVEVTPTSAFQAAPPRRLFGAPAAFLARILVDPEIDGFFNSIYCSNGSRGCEQGSISRSGQRFVFAVGIPPARQEVTVAPEILAKYAGTYLSEGDDNFRGWTVTLVGNQLMIQRVSVKPTSAPLFAESETKFFLKVGSGDFEFVKDDKGEVKFLLTHHFPRGGVRVAIRQ